MSVPVRLEECHRLPWHRRLLPLPAAAPIPAPAARTDDPRWATPALVALLSGTALLYVAGLGASGWANTFYSAAAQAGATSWKAFFFGSSDAANSIMVDKPSASLWVMALSARIFGVNPWSILVPQALEGVAAVGVLYATVRRWHGPSAGLLAGATFALTPVAALMFRFNNPDALLVLLLTLGAYALVRAVESACTRWLLAAAASIGFAFLTKSLLAFVVVPAFSLVYLVTAPTGLRHRAAQLLAAGVALVVTAGWWVAIVELIPAADRPYAGGSQTNSVLELIFSYNGFGRLTGNEPGSIGGPPRGGSGAFGGGGITELANPSWGGQIAWLLPAALLFFVALMWLSRRAPPSSQLITLLQADAARYTWVAAATGSNRAASYQLATGEPVMPMGGFNGTDPSPTLEQFQHYVAQGQIHYLIGGGEFGRRNGGANTSSQIAAWVAEHFTSRMVDGVTVYDLTAMTS